MTPRKLKNCIKKFQNYSQNSIQLPQEFTYPKHKIRHPKHKIYSIQKILITYISQLPLLLNINNKKSTAMNFLHNSAIAPGTNINRSMKSYCCCFHCPPLMKWRLLFLILVLMFRLFFGIFFRFMLSRCLLWEWFLGHFYV